MSLLQYTIIDFRTRNTFTTSRVSVYNEGGWVKDLPSLNLGRSNHGCGHFVNTDNKMVIYDILCILCSLSCVQVYLVAGGQNTLTSSTELLVQGAAAWTEAGPLPHKMYGFRTVSINNAVIATGSTPCASFNLLYHPVYCRGV